MIALGALLAWTAVAPAAEEPKKEEIVLVAGEKPPKDHVNPQVLLAVDKLPAGKSAQFAVVIDIESGWHINTNPAKPSFAIPTTVAVKGKHGTKAAKVEFPKGRDLKIEGLDQPVSVYEGRVVLFGTLAVPDEAARQTEELTVEVKFQACNEKACLAPKTAKLVGKVPVAGQGEQVKAINGKLFEKDEKRSAEPAGANRS
jgi:hypothetical protein